MNLINGFIETASRHGRRPALFVDGQHASYEELARRAGQISATISGAGRTPSRLAALFAHRSMVAYSGVLGILLSGRGYVPLNPKLPASRNGNMLEQSGSDVVVVGHECLSRLRDLLSCASRPLTLILPDVDDVGELGARFPEHAFVTAGSMSPGPGTLSPPAGVDADATAYLLFTSGSTGDPKGVPVSHENVRSYVETSRIDSASATTTGFPSPST